MVPIDLHTHDKHDTANLKNQLNPVATAVNSLNDGNYQHE
jgi:hypothetical protein